MWLICTLQLWTARSGDQFIAQPTIGSDAACRLGSKGI
jgi:hypothetical protein